jgi:hypothetical protein
MFGDTTRTMEQTETGEFKDIERFNRYVNGPELIKMWQTAADVILQEDVPGWADMIPKLTNVVAMSKWGQQFYQPSRLVYHGVDPDHFWPVKEKPITLSTGEVLRTKRDAKKAFGFNPDSFVIGRIDSNSGRKDYPALVKALAGKPVAEDRDLLDRLVVGGLGQAADGHGVARVVVHVGS